MPRAGGCIEGTSCGLFTPLLTSAEAVWLVFGLALLALLVLGALAWRDARRAERGWRDGQG